MKRIFALIIAIFPALLFAQDLSSVWSQVSINNLTLKAMQQQLEAEKMDNHIGLVPENPEVEFAYLWGSPTTMGNRIDVSVTQSFDFPTTYVYRGRIADLKDKQLDYALQKQSQELLLEIGKLYYEIVYQNVRIKDMERCLKYLSDVSAAYQQKMETGAVNIFDYNKVKLAELNLQQEKSHAEADRINMLLKMKQLNGGIDMKITVSEFPSFEVPSDFDAWYRQVAAQNPALLWIENQQALQQQQLKLDKSMWAPQFFAGYMREQVPSETFQGVKIGMSVPLWNNVNTVKKTQLQGSALQLLALDEDRKLYNDLQAHHTMVISLKTQIDGYRQLLSTVDAAELLQQALQSGQISVVDYLYESSIYHESHERFAELQFEAALQYVELQVVDANLR